MGRRTKRKRRAEAVGPVETPTARKGWFRRRWPILLIVIAGGFAGAVWAVGRDLEPTVFDYDVVNAYPHDPNAYCQGLVYADGFLYEGTGQYGESSLRKVELETGRVLQQVQLERRWFGEGITLWRDRLIQLTWKGGFAVLYDKETFQEQQRLSYSGQGWGVTHDGTHLITSDGSSTLRFRDPETFRVVRQLRVKNRGWSVRNLNELEYVNGNILANVWHKEYIAVISPRTGDVTAIIDLRGLLPNHERRDREAVLNGIAYDAEKERLFVTGKNWPKLFEVRLKNRSH